MGLRFTLAFASLASAWGARQTGHMFELESAEDSSSVDWSTREKRACQSCMWFYPTMEPGLFMESNMDKKKFFEDFAKSKAELLKPECSKLMGDSERQTLECEGVLMKKLVALPQLAFCYDELDTPEHFCGCMVSSKRGPQCPEDLPQRPSSEVSKPKAKKMKKIWKPTKNQQEQCAACTEFWPYFSPGVVLESNMEKKEFFTGAEEEEKIMMLKEKCPDDISSSNCVKILNQVSTKHEIARCWDKTFSQDFCGCIVTGGMEYSKPALCP